MGGCADSADNSESMALRRNEMPFLDFPLSPSELADVFTADTSDLCDFF